MGAKKQLRCKNMMYTQQVDHLSKKTIPELEELIEKSLAPKKYAVILHDKDIDEHGQPEAPHVHAMLSFDNARSINNVANLLGDKPQYVEAWKGSAQNGYAYLIHATDGAQMKHQYSTAEVAANFDYPALIQSISKEVDNANTFKSSTKIKTLLNLLYVGKVTKEEVEKQLTGAEYAKARNQIEAVHAKRLINEADEWRKEMQAQGKFIKIIWICGGAGTGKTSFAKEYARKTGQPFFISGSTKDKFQNYAGEHIMILDELRPDDMEYHDLLRITDPYGIDSEVMAPARYNDKALACEVILITTPYDPASFYEERFGVIDDKKKESFQQLLRRLSTVMLMTDTQITLMVYSESMRKFIPQNGFSKQNTYSAKSRSGTAINSFDMFNSMFD